MNSIPGALSAAVKARELLSQETPLRRDCGRLCARACCRPDGAHLSGMLLFPGEEALYETPQQGFILHEKGLLTCSGECERDTRPLACRVFPLAFTLRGGEPGVRMDPRAFAVCPLAESGVEGLSSSFVNAAKQAARILCANPETFAFIQAQDEFIRGLTRPLWGEGA